MIQLYQTHNSGNCYKVRLLLAHLRRPYRAVELDLRQGEARTDAFRARNPIGRVPTVELAPGTHLGESNAILWYFAEGTPYVPADRLERARCLQWMFFEQYSHEPYVAVARAWLTYYGVPPGKGADLEERIQKGHAALAVMESHLQQHAFFAGPRYSIADIALYAYTHVAEEGRISLGRYPAVQHWLERVRQQPGHVRLQDPVPQF